MDGRRALAAVCRFRRTWPLSCWFMGISVAAAAPMVLQDRSNMQIVLLLTLSLGQCLAAAGWLVLGRAARPLRAMVWLLATAGLAVAYMYALAAVPLFDWIALRSGATMFATVIAVSAVAWTFCWTVLLRWLHGGRARPPLVNARISVRELFGWIIVVAVASTALRCVDLTIVHGEPSDWLWLAAPPAPAALAMALLLGEGWGRSAPGVLTTGAAMAAALALLASFENVDGEWVIIAASYAYVGVWIAVQRLDQRAARRSAPA